MKTTKKLLSLLLCLLMVASIIPVSALAAVRPPLISTLEFGCEGLKNLKPGSTVPASNTFTAPTRLTVVAVGYTKDGLKYSASTFEEGSYTVNILVAMANGADITESFIAKFNDKAAKVAYSNSETFNIPAGMALVYQDFTVENEIITCVDFNVLGKYEVGADITKIGVAPMTQGVVFEGVPYFYGNNYWFTDAGDTTNTISSGTFESGKTYWLFIVISLEEGYEFSEDITAKNIYLPIGYKDANVAYFKADKKQLNVRLELKALGVNYIEDVELGLNGYTYGEKVTEAKATENMAGVKFLADIYGGGYYFTDESYNAITDTNAVFEEGVDYILAINLKASSGYDFNVTKDNITLMGYNCDFSIAQQQNGNLSLYFKLPKLVSPYTVAEADFVLDGYEIGESPNYLSVSTNAAGIELADDGNVNQCEIWDSSNQPTTHESFIAGGIYRIAVCFEVKTGYNFNSAEAANILKIKDATMLSISKTGKYYTAVFALPTLKKKDITSIDVKITDPVAYAAISKNATVVSSPADAIKKTYISWFECDTNSSVFSDWRQMNDGEQFKEGNYYLVKLGFEPYDKYQFPETIETTVNEKANNNSFGAEDYALNWLSYSYCWYIPMHNCADYLTHVAGEKADCSNSGIIAHYLCTYNSCGRTYSDDAATTEIYEIVIDSLGHEFFMTFPVADATCETEGRTAAFKVCRRCNNKYLTTDETTPLTDADLQAIIIPKKGHKGGTATCMEKAICDVCETAYGELDPTNHEAVDVLDAYPPTCGNTGMTEGEVCICGETIKAQTSIPATGEHTYKDVVTKATLSKDGKIETKCSDCGDVKSTKTIYIPKTATLSTTKYLYDGKNKTPSLTIKDSKNNTLVKGTDYTVSVASERKAVGKYTVTIKFIGKYSGEAKRYFYILPNKTTKTVVTQNTSAIKVQWAKVTGATGYAVEIYDANNKKLNTKYTTALEMTYKGLKTATVYKLKIVAYKTIDGKKELSTVGTVVTTATQPAKPTLKATSTKGKLNLSWTNVIGETGYVIQYSTKKDSGFKKLTDTKANVATYSKSVTSGKTYYFRVKSYKKVGDTYIYSAYSDVKGIKIK